MSNKDSTMIHNNIKINYVEAGYLPNWPYHLISDDEMCDAFMRDVVIDRTGCRYDETIHDYVGTKFVSGSGYFFDNYPLLNPSLEQAYCNLIEVLWYYICNAKMYIKECGETYIFPNWIYSYMLGKALSVNSSIADLHDLLVLIDCDNTDDEFTGDASAICYAISKDWMSKAKNDLSEWAIIKVSSIDKLSSGVPGKLYYDMSTKQYYKWVKESTPLKAHFERVSDYSTIDVPVSEKGYATRKIPLRPPTMFGENHIIKSIRIKLADPNYSKDWGRYPIDSNIPITE